MYKNRKKITRNNIIERDTELLVDSVDNNYI